MHIQETYIEDTSYMLGQSLYLYFHGCVPQRVLTKQPYPFKHGLITINGSLVPGNYNGITINGYQALLSSSLKTANSSLLK